jgi:hypothetical protein
MKKPAVPVSYRYTRYGACVPTDQKRHVVQLKQRSGWIQVTPTRYDESRDGGSPTTDPGWYCPPIHSFPEVV